MSCTWQELNIEHTW